jgi:hypothetical protein
VTAKGLAKHGLARRLRLYGLALALAGSGTAARAQSAHPGGLSPEMQKLAFLLGKWKGTGRSLQPAPGPRRPRTFTETLVTTRVVGGNYLMIEMQVQWPGEPLENALMLIGYDPAARLYRLSWFFAGSGRPGEWSGSFEGTKLVLTNERELRERPLAFAGVGLQLERNPTKAGDFRVHLALPNTPAGRAGLKSGDVIRAIDGRPAKGMTVDQGLALMRGPTGTGLRLTLRRVGRDREVTLTRQQIVLRVDPLRVTLAPISPAGLSELIEVSRGGRYQKQSEVSFAASR